MFYTYLVDHKDEAPTVAAKMEVNGGEVIAVQFSDAFDELDRMRVALERCMEVESVLPPATVELAKKALNGWA